MLCLDYIFIQKYSENVNCENDMFVFGIVMFSMEW